MTGYKKTYKLPFKFDIPNLAEIYIEQRSFILSFIKYFKRYIYICINGQNKLEIYKILPRHNKILWINLSAPSLGDSLMDLSNRVLLEGRNTVLFTDKKNSNLYENDLIFNNVYTQINELMNQQFDLVIVDSFSTRSMQIKAKVAPLVPYVGIFGYYNGPEVNRVLFSFHQMNNLLGYKNTEDEINSSSKVSLYISIKDRDLVRNIGLPKKYISVAIGGEWNHRTYKKWDEVISKLMKVDRDLNIVLLGSINGNEMAKKLLKKIPLKTIFNCVNKFSFMQTAEIIKNSQVLLCCDGGLMHAANAVETPIISLFARLSTQMQLTERSISFSLYDNNDVNNIEVEKILKEYSKFMSYVDNHPQV
jgi:ADP-heptose:LPS heptosyltransferase